MKILNLFLSLIQITAFAQIVSRVDGRENLNPNVQAHLYEEQVEHAKDFWGDLFSQGNTIGHEYYPESRPKFKLAYYLVPEQIADFFEVKSLNSEVRNQLTTKINNKNYFKLFVHPESESYYRFLLKNGAKYVSREASEFTASPTSSFRSLIVWNNSSANIRPFVAKVSLDKIVDQSDRLVSRSEIERSIANQNMFDDVGRTKLRNMGMDIYKESAALTLKGYVVDAPQKIGGQIIREIPDEVLQGKKRWISLASLMSRHRNRIKIADSIAATGMQTEEYLKKFIVDDYMNTFRQLSFEYGVNFEPHSQNLLMEFDTSLRPTGVFVLRDFGGVWPDAIQMAKSHPDLLKHYITPGSANKFRFQGARGNYFSSFVFYYKAHFTDKLFPEILQREGSLTSSQINSLNKRMDDKFIALVRQYLDSNYSSVPSMQNYKDLGEYIRGHTKFSSGEMVTLDPQTAQRMLVNKDVLGETVTFSKIKKWESLEFKSNDLGVFRFENGYVTQYALFTTQERRLYKQNLANFFNNHSQIRAVDCSKFVPASLFL